jgi:dTDP-4-amino-4,6-dideoxy-D-galactose acyltransferase
MTSTSRRNPAVERAGELPPEAVASLVKAHGRSRELLEPWPGDRVTRLAGRIATDAARDDAVSFVIPGEDGLAGLLVLRLPRWDAEHFGFGVARVEHVQAAGDGELRSLASAAVAEAEARGVRMCSARVHGGALGALRVLEDAGFRYVDSMLAPWRELTSWQPKGFAVTRPARPDDVDALSGIARRAFRTDRFHRDPDFLPGAADGVYERWVRTWMSAGDDTRPPTRTSLVLRIGNEPAGFFFMRREAENAGSGEAVARVVLDAVDPAHAGQGHGFRMYCDALDVARRHASACTADISAANPAVVNLFAKLGFRLVAEGDVTMHWWSRK